MNCCHFVVGPAPMNTCSVPNQLTQTPPTNHSPPMQQSSVYGGSSIASARNQRGGTLSNRGGGASRAIPGGADNTMDDRYQQQQNQQQGNLIDLNNISPNNNNNSTSNEDIVVSAAMQQLRDPGVLIVAHGSRGKPKTVRLVLTESAITWRTEMRKKSATSTGGKELKLGKLHQVPLSHIMYVDIGKQTTALRRVENAAVAEALCFSLLTKEGSLDLEANSPRERDALVQCFSLVLDEVHAQNWRDIYRGPSSDMPSSFDEGDNNGVGGMMGIGP
jgi:hypothetical protein